MTTKPLIFTLLLWALSAGWQSGAFAHALLERADPRVGAELTSSPPQAVLYFDSSLEPAFSGFRIEETGGDVVAESHGSDSGDQSRLSATLPPLPPGTYKVLWSVVARDGHRTEGDYTFTIR